MRLLLPYLIIAASLLPIDAAAEPCYSFQQALRVYPRSKIWWRGDHCWMAIELLRKLPQHEEPTFANRPFPDVRIHYPVLHRTQFAEWRMPRDAFSSIAADHWRPLEFRRRSFVPWDERVGGR